MSTADTHVRALIETNTETSADERRMPFEAKSPNATTRMAIPELEAGKDKRFEPLIPNETTIATMREARAGNLKSFDSVESLMADLHSED